MTGGPAPARFLAAGEWERARWVLFGAPLDVTATFRPGARFGPAAVRAASPVLEDWSPTQGSGLGEHAFADIGDLEFAPGDVEGALEGVAACVRRVVGAGKRPLMLGGEHLVTWPAVRVLAAAYPGLAVLQFDAHCDLRDEYLGRRASHATVMRRVAEVVGADRCYQLGVRSGTAAEWAFGRAHTRFRPGEPRLPAEWLPELRGRPLYVTVDVDFVDPAYAPGTGTPEPGGPRAADLLASLADLVGMSVVGADVVEVAPAYDPAGITAVLAAKVARELLLLP